MCAGHQRTLRTIAYEQALNTEVELYRDTQLILLEALEFLVTSTRIDVEVLSATTGIALPALHTLNRCRCRYQEILQDCNVLHLHHTIVRTVLQTQQ
jgi:hypothetical protein